MFKNILRAVCLIVFVSFSLYLVGVVRAQTSGNTYYVSTTGNDSSAGTQAQPWLTIGKAVLNVKAGDTVVIRGGTYQGGQMAKFQNSGTQAKPITFKNYSGEQVIIKMGSGDMFVCAINPQNPVSWNTPKADFIKFIGSDVTPHTLTNGVQSKKGIVIQGVEGQQGGVFSSSDCDSWEIAGIDFVDVGYGMFTFKNNWRGTVEHSTDNWYVHDNRVYGFYRESGMQFNGDNNTVINNEIYKVTSRIDTPYGCQNLNFLGDSNIVRGNTLVGTGSTAECTGILLEWDLSDNNLIEQNKIIDSTRGIDIEGGDNNIIRNNLIYTSKTPNQNPSGIEIKSYDGSVKKDWPCNEETGSAQSLLPPNDSSYPDWTNYYNPRNCHSFGNKIYNNVIHGYVQSLYFYALAGESTIVRNNVLSAWTRGSVCFYQSSTGTCKALGPNITADHNGDQGTFGFVNLGSYNFHLAANSPLINTGYDLGGAVPNDFEGNSRPQGGSYDIGAYEYMSGGPVITPTASPLITASPSPIPTITASPTPVVKPGDANSDGSVNDADYTIWLNHYGEVITGIGNGDFNGDTKVDGVDYVIWLNNYGK